MYGVDPVPPLRARQVGLPPAATATNVALPDVYLWVFDNRISPFWNSPGSGFAVNIPASKGMYVDYFEASQRKNKDGSWEAHHDADPTLLVRSDGLSTGTPTATWPDEDQLHHFAGYFYLGAFFSANNIYPFSALPYETRALRKTGDYPFSDNPGDYWLGLVADDIGRAYQDSPGYSSPPNSASPTIRIWQDLKMTESSAISADGRTFVP